MITLKSAPSRQRHDPSEVLTLACHDPVDHFLGQPCIHIGSTKRSHIHFRHSIGNLVTLLTVEILHCVLLEVGVEDDRADEREYDVGWENTHGYFEEAKRIINPQEK